MTGDRNTVHEIVFNMDDNITRLQANLAVLEELTKDYMLKGATDNQTNVGWIVGKVVDTTDELRKRYNRLFEATKDQRQNSPEPPVEPAGKAPEPSPKAEPPVTGGTASELPDHPDERWRELRSRWLRMQAEWAASDPEQDRADRLTMEEGPLVLAMAATPVRRRFLEEKLEVLDYVMFHDSTSDWTDRRDELLLNSIKADVKGL